jgi:DNA segregation ATPase FtsK/SpoIIIE-like protein
MAVARAFNLLGSNGDLPAMTKAQEMLDLAEDIEAVTGPGIMSDLPLSRDERKLIISTLRAAAQPQSPEHEIAKWRDDALEKAALIVLQWGADPAIAFDIRALKTSPATSNAPNKPAGISHGGVPTESELAMALGFILEKPSVSYIQRRMGLTYNRAMAIMETLENDGVVSRPSKSGARTILSHTRPDREGK